MKRHVSGPTQLTCPTGTPRVAGKACGVIAIRQKYSCFRRNALGPPQNAGMQVLTLDDCHWQDKVVPLWHSILKSSRKKGVGVGRSR